MRSSALSPVVRADDDFRDARKLKIIFAEAVEQFTPSIYGIYMYHSKERVSTYCAHHIPGTWYVVVGGSRPCSSPSKQPSLPEPCAYVGKEARYVPPGSYLLVRPLRLYRAT